MTTTTIRHSALVGHRGRRLSSPRLSGWASDVLVALIPAVLGVYQALALAQEEVGKHGRLGFAAAAVAAGALLLVRRRWPLLSLIGVVAVVGWTPVIGIPLSNSGLFAVALACYSQACHTRRAPAWVGWAMTILVPIGVTLSQVPEARTGFLRELGATIAIAQLLFALASYAGHVQRQRRAASATLTDRALRLQDEGQTLAELDVAEERGRIARDLQQIVVAAVDVLRARTAAAVRAVDSGTDSAERAIDAVGDCGRGALVEMRRLLGVLRADDADTSDAIVDVDQLRREAADAGVIVSFDLRVSVGELPAVVAHALRRFVEVAVGAVSTTAGPRRLDVAALPSANGLQLRAQPAGAAGRQAVSALPPWDPALSALAERLRVLGGHLDVTWHAAGPELRTTVPLDVDGAPRSQPAPAAPRLEGAPVAPGGLAARRRVPPALFDPLAALVVGTLGIVELLSRKPTPHLPVPDEIAPGVVLMLAFAATLLVRRRWMLPGFAAVLVLTLLVGLPFVRKSDAIQLVIAIYLFTIASRCSWRVVAAATAAALVAEIPHLMRVDWTCLCVVLILSVVAGAVATGRVAHHRDALNAALRRRVQEVTRQRSREAQLAVSQERRRIAREMHDLVAHRLSILVLQTGAAAGLVSRDPGRARAMLDEVAESADALSAELHALLGDVGEDEVLVADIQSLVDDAAKAGLDVDLLIDDSFEASPGARVAAYRIVQEGLTNVRKHAPGAKVTVRLRRDDDGLHVEVRNTSPRGDASAASVAATGSGQGLTGIRERVGVFDGRVDAHADPDGGFTLRASLPELAAV